MRFWTYRRAGAAKVLAMISVCAALAGLSHADTGKKRLLEGARIASIHVIDDAGHAVTAPLGLPLKAGAPFHIEDERESLRALYRTGLFSDIRTLAVNTPRGLVVTFVIRRNYYNNVVSIQGIQDDHLLGRALAAMGLPLGEIFEEQAVKDGIVRLKATLQDDGYYEPRVTYTLSPHAGTRQMDVTVAVELGERARIGAIQFQNESRFPAEELKEESKLSTGNELSAARLERAQARIRKYLVKKNYLGSHVTLVRGVFDPGTKTVPLTLVVQAGPRVRVTAEGAHYSQGKLKNLIPVFEEGSVDEDLLIEGRRNLRDDQQKQGYFDAQVSYQMHVDLQRKEQVITYTVNRGKKHRLVGIDFSGNRYLSTQLLQDRLTIHTASFLSPGRFSEQLLQNDAASIRSVYQSNGFRDVKVKTDLVQGYKGRASDLFVHFLINEGPQTLVHNLKIEGNHALSDAQIQTVIGSTAGQPYSDANVASDRDNVLAYYFNEGFPHATFAATQTASKEPNRVDLVYKIDEGPQVRVDQIYLSGYVHTRPGVIRRQVTVEAGQPLRQSSVIETQRKLYNLGIFNRVTVAPQNPDGTAPDKNVVVSVEEAKRYTLGYGFGFEAQRIGGTSGNPGGTQLNASPEGIFQISKNNVGGRAQTLGFQARASTLDYQALASYVVPDFFAHQRFSLQLTAFAEKSQEVQTFTSRRYEGSLQVTEAFTPYTSLLYRYTFRRVLVDASSLQIPPEEIPLLSQPTLISGFGLTWLRDRRDNPADATHGSYNTIDVGQAARSLGSGAGFFRGFIQNSTYYKLGRSVVFARSARFGMEQTFPGTTDFDVPLPERFFAGGGTTLRGFGLNQAGPRDPTTGFPVGGLAELIFNQELRFPMHLPIVGSRIGGSLFYDAGNVYSSLDKITFRWKSASPRDLEYFSHTIGFGLRYATPVGPVRVDFGYQLNPAEFTFKDPITRFTETSQLPHFQFFFSIGPSF